MQMKIVIAEKPGAPEPKVEEKVQELRPTWYGTYYFKMRSYCRPEFFVCQIIDVRTGREDELPGYSPTQTPNFDRIKCTCVRCVEEEALAIKHRIAPYDARWITYREAEEIKEARCQRARAGVAAHEAKRAAERAEFDALEKRVV